MIEDFGGVANGEKECIILGNGPSLRETIASGDYEFIKGKNIFCVNRFPTTDIFWELKPQSVFFMDPSYWTKNLQNNLDEIFQGIYDSLLDVDWDIDLVLSKRAMKWNFFQDLPDKNENISLRYICTVPHSLEKSQEERFEEYKANISMPSLQNVLVACIYMAINMGYEKIYLFGFDHDWHESIHVNDDNLLCQKVEHFFTDGSSKIEYTPIYKDASHTQKSYLYEWFYAVAKAHEAYYHLRQYADYMDVKVYNASKKTCIDVFERVKLDTI